MNKMKNCFKLMPYSVGFKRQIFFSGLLVLLGVVIEILSGCSNMIGGFYIALMGVMPGQTLLFVTVPGAVKASPSYSQIAVKLHPMVNFICELICFTIVVLIHGIYAMANPQRADVSMCIVFIVAMVVFVSQIGMPIMYKHYWLGFVLVMACVMLLLLPLGEYIYGDASLHLPMPVYLIGGYLLVILGWLASIAVNKLFYKRELDPMCYKNMMKKLDGSL